MKNFLTENTLKVLSELSSYEYLSNFTLVGGSAIAYHLNHRLSEDLDFFSWEANLPPNTVSFLNGLKVKHQLEISNISNSYLDVFIDDVKTTFFANNWIELKSRSSNLVENIFVAELDLLCAMKINALSLRAKFRDYYDLYVINREKFTIEEMLDISLKLIPGMTKKVFSMQLAFINDIEDESINHLFPRIKISLRDIQKHFTRELRKIL